MPRWSKAPLARGPGSWWLHSPFEESASPEAGQGLSDKEHCLSVTYLCKKGDVLPATLQGQLCATSMHLGNTALTLTQTVHIPRMSLQIFNDENVTGGRNTENCDFLFSPPELTGRSSVLRLSQKENVPPKSIARAMKVSMFCLGHPGTHSPGDARSR